MAGTSRKHRKAILGKKLGMTQIFDDEGRWIPVTVLKAGPCTVVQVKTPETDGYSAVQLAFDDRRKQMRRPQQALLDSLGVTPKRIIQEVPFVDEADVLSGEEIAVIKAEELALKAASLAAGKGTQKATKQKDAPAADEPEAKAEESAETEESAEADDAESTEADADAAADGDSEEASEEAPAEEEAPEAAEKSGEAGKLAPGAQIGVRTLSGLEKVDVQGLTKGRGFTGTIKRHGFASGDKSHGSKNVREPGSTGMHTDPGRVFKGRKMPGQHGNQVRKIRNLAVVHLDEKKNLLLVKGAVPGPNGGYVYIEESLS